MDNGRRNYGSVNLRSGLGDPRYTNSYINPSPFSGTEYGSGLLATRYPDLSEGHGQDVNWIDASPIAYPGATLPGFSFDTPPHQDNHVYGTSFHSHQQGSAMISLCDPGVAPEIRAQIVEAATEKNGDQDTGTYLALPEQWEAVLGPIPSTTDYMQPLFPAPSHLGDRAANVTFEVSAPERPAHNTRRCPVCPALLGRLQDRKRHKLSHLPQWLQCPDPGCSWRGDRWENLKKHRLKVHPSISQESDKCKCIIYDPWPLVKMITDNTTFEDARNRAISLVEKRAIEVGKLELWGNFWGRKERKARKV